MDQVGKMVKGLPKRLADMNPATRMLLLGLIAAAVLVTVAISVFSSGATYQYAFTNLSPEDSSEAAAVLKASGIAFRSEANGAALAVPAAQVHDARLLLASQGLPRGGGVGFELFDRGDFGASEFTQRVNLRRATEGELARTISRLQAVRSARVHVTMPEKGLYRDDDRHASAAVVLNLQPGRTMHERELAGVRHLVASAVPGMDADKVTVVDQRGSVLSGDRSETGKLASQAHEIESSLEQRIVDVLEPTVGHGYVVARVTANLDSTEIETTQDNYDPETTAVRSERKTTESIASDTGGGTGVAGAAANQPMGAGAGAGSNANRSQTNREDEVRNFEIAKKVTRTVSRVPRIVRLSAAVMIDGIDGKPRPVDDVRRLTELAKRAMGFDPQRGDVIEFTSSPFAKVEEADTKLPVWERPVVWRLGKMIGIGLLGLLGIFFLLRITRRSSTSTAVAMIKPGTRVREVEANMRSGEAWEMVAEDNTVALRERARELSKADPGKAAHLLKAWVDADIEASQEAKETTVV
jgi:flagellar M-ring protein FliF